MRTADVPARAIERGATTHSTPPRVNRLAVRQRRDIAGRRHR
ncbi:MAG: hypothetical protein AVDCRST_MAG88-1996 [uncultured Thermomicrobiales bacterium]|uniref:Uncharacterized protein n=1 Tax=uncultured Thermomicrobiales bacterium TaxID=1645740 RepID=A0A6J4V525_9BACT|nr:MAG: hypothetical protein AVDCRST_MAG88-1996 [uncultured Thermomicrobiales bacterium]